MKILTAIVVGLTTCTSHLDAQPFTGADRFDDIEQNAELWKPAVLVGNANLIQSSGKISFTVAGGPAIVSDDLGIWDWNGKASATNDWSMQMDLHVPLPISPLTSVEGKPQRYGFGVAVTKTGTEPVQAFMTSAVVARVLNATESSHEFLSEFVDGASGTYNVLTVPNGTPFTSVRIRWDANSQTLFAEYDPDGPVNGYEWAVLQEVPSNVWSMTDSDSFSVFIDGFSYGLTITEGHELNGDNFVATVGNETPPIQPKLRLATELVWNSPLNKLQQIQSSTDLITWTNVGLPTIGNGQMTNAFQPGPLTSNKFFRVITQ